MYFNFIIFILIFTKNIITNQAFNVQFHYNSNLNVQPFNTQIYKRELNQPFLEKSLFSLNGFEKVESIPVLFPIDICIFNLEGNKYAASLHMNRNGTRNFAVLQMQNGSYATLADFPMHNGIAMDCINFNNKGYVVVTQNLSQPVQYAKQGSPLFEITGNRLRSVQYFAAINLNSMFLRVSGNDFFLLQTFQNTKSAPNLFCPQFKWSGTTFNKLAAIPCSNAKHLEPFSIDYESYVAVANYADQKGRTETNSEIYKFSKAKKKFELFQRIRTNGAVDVRYFSVPQNQVKRQHFLIFGNSITSAAKREGKNFEAESVVYTFENGQFIPHQKISLYAVEKFLPVENVEAEKFILLIACTDQDIKIYNLNDWKLEESTVQFTEGALGKGVANMRIYQEQDKSYLIIANELMADHETNIFLPIFKRDAHANALRQRIIDWVNGEVERIKKFDVKALTQRTEEKLKRLEKFNYLPEIRDIPAANISSVITKSLIYPKMRMSANYWKALSYANQAVDVLEQQLKHKQRMRRSIEDYADEDSTNNFEYIYDSVNVETLKVNSKLKAKIVNGIAVENPIFKEISASKVIISNEYKKPSTRSTTMEDDDNPNDIHNSEVMFIKNLKMSGKLNQIPINDILNNTLKTEADVQFLKAPVKIRNLTANALMATNDEINGQHLSKLIPIDGGQYVVNQDIQFSKIRCKNLDIHERLNNLHVLNGKFEVLLKRSNVTQIIEGAKRVDTIKVMELITVAGQMMGRQFESISPNKAIHEELLLEGDFIINGDVGIDKNLQVLDIIDLKQRLSVKQVMNLGIRMDKSLQDNKLKFQRPIKANNSLISFANGMDLQRLVRLNNDDVQIIEGEKIFDNDLVIEGGFSEVKNLNQHDIEELERLLFLKNTNQTIKVPVKFKGIEAKSINSPLLLINNKNLSEYLTKTGNQKIDGALLINNLKADKLHVGNLITNHKIFQNHITDIYQQKSRNAPADGVFHPNQKFHGSVYVNNLILNSKLNGRSTEEIEKELLQLEGNIKYVGDFKFNYPMNITKLQFHGMLNGISAEDFGKCWLQKNNKNSERQEFKESVNVASVNFKSDNIEMQGKLNGLTMEDYHSKTYWINRDEQLGEVIFENPIEITNELTTNTLNNYRIPQDILYKSSKTPQILQHALRVQANFNIENGQMQNISNINYLNLCDLNKYLNAVNLNALYVENAYFQAGPPFYKTLNQHDIRNTLNSIWLVNENVVIQDQIEITEANFEGLLEFEGSINDMNMEFLKENYFSKSKPQSTAVELIFAKGLIFNNSIEVNDLRVHESITDSDSLITFNFDEFVSSTLKTSGPHVISGNWTILEAIVEGNLNDVLVNNLNLVNDVLHKHMQTKNQATFNIIAPKVFKSAKFENVYADAKSTINHVNVARWLQDAVYLYENYTISGKTTVDSINIFNNILVMGRVNNLTFSEKSLLLQNKDQMLPKSLKIISHLSEEKRFLTNNIENLYADYINGHDVKQFITNFMPFNGNAEIQSHLIFKEPLNVEKYQGPEGFLTQNKWFKRNLDYNGNQEPIWNTINYEESLDYLYNTTKDKHFVLDHFEIIQTIDVHSTAAAAFSLCLINKETNKPMDILLLWDYVDNDEQIYQFKWLTENKQFIKTEAISWIPKDKVLLDILHEHSKQRCYHEQDLLQLVNVASEQLQRFPSNKLQVLNHYDDDDNCLLTYEQNRSMSNAQILCILSGKEKLFTLTSNNIQQISVISNKSLALLSNNSLEICNIFGIHKANIFQKINIVYPEQIDCGIKGNFHYIAVLIRSNRDSLNKGFIEIYRSYNNTGYRLWQVIDCLEPQQLEFVYISETDDLLLFVQTASIPKPLLIYQYQGIQGFTEILSNSILVPNFKMKIIKLKSSAMYVVGLMAQNKFTLVETVLKSL